MPSFGLLLAATPLQVTMRHRLICAVLFAVLLALPVSAAAQSSSFTIIALPDTQFYSQDHPAIFFNQTKWIAANKSALNIQLVLGLGDIVNAGTSATQWENASAAIKTLDGNVPYLLAIGNHDYDGSPKGRSAQNYNNYFGPTRYSPYAYYKGNYNGSNENYYGVVTLGGQPFLILLLEFMPRNAVLDWASSILSANADKPAIIVTHGYMFGDNLRMNTCTRTSVHAYAMSSDSNAGDGVWNKLVTQHSNVAMVLSGHVVDDGGSGRRTDIAPLGNLVNQMLSDYQAWTNGGDGYLRIIKVNPAANTVTVQTYSPYLNKYLTDSKNNFTVPNRNTGLPPSGTGAYEGHVYGSNCSALSGAKVSFTGGSASTNSSGYFKASVASPANLSLTVSANGYDAANKQAPVFPGFNTELDWYMAASSFSDGGDGGGGGASGGGSCVAATDHTVAICAPTSGSTVGSPVDFDAAALDKEHSVTAMVLYVDSKNVAKSTSASLSASVPLANGKHNIVIRAWDSTGFFFSSSETITVGSSTTPAPTVSITAGPMTIASGALSTLSASAQNADTLVVTGSDGSSYTMSSTGGSVTVSPTQTTTYTAKATNSAGQAATASATITVSSTSGGGSGACTASTDRTVNICSPAVNATVASPVQFSAAALDKEHTVTAMTLYVDSQVAARSTSATITASVPMASGKHFIVIRAWDSSGFYFSSSEYVTVP